MFTPTPPRLTVLAFRAVAQSRDGVAVWLTAVDAVEAAPAGLTKGQALDPSIVVILDPVEALSYIATAREALGVDATAREVYRSATDAANASLSWQFRMGYLSADEQVAEVTR